MPSAIFERGGQLYQVPYEGAWTPEKQRAAMERVLRGELPPLPAQEAARLRRELAAKSPAPMPRAPAPPPSEAAPPQPSWLEQAREAVPWPVWTLASLAAPFAAGWAAPLLLARIGAPAAIAALTRLAAPVAATAAVEAARGGEVGPGLLLSLGAPIAAGGAAARWAPGLAARGAGLLAAPAAKEAAKEAAQKWATRLAGPTARVLTTGIVEGERGGDWMLPTLAQGASEVLFGPGAHLVRRFGARGKAAAEEAAKPIKEEIARHERAATEAVLGERRQLTNLLVDYLRAVVEPWRNFPGGVKGLEAIMREPAGRHALSDYYARGLQKIRDLVEGRNLALPPEVAAMVRRPGTIVRQVEVPGGPVHLVDAAEAIEGVSKLSPDQRWQAVRAIEDALTDAGLHPPLEAWQTIRRQFREGIRWLREFEGKVPITGPGKAGTEAAAVKGLASPEAILRQLAQRRWRAIGPEDEVAKVARKVVDRARQALAKESAAKQEARAAIEPLREELKLYAQPSFGMSIPLAGVHFWAHPKMSYYPGIPRTAPERASAERGAALFGLGARSVVTSSEGGGE